MQVAEPRRCPHCQRWLYFWQERYLCRECQLIFTKEETIAYSNEHLNGFCSFVTSECEVGLYYTCLKCKKSIFVSNEEQQAYEERIKKMFEEAPQKRIELLQWQQDVQQRIDNLNAVDAIRKQIANMTPQERANIKVVVNKG